MIHCEKGADPLIDRVWIHPWDRPAPFCFVPHLLLMIPGHIPSDASLKQLREEGAGDQRADGGGNQRLINERVVQQVGQSLRVNRGDDEGSSPSSFIGTVFQRIDR